MNVLTQAADFFGNYSMHANDFYERPELIDKISRIFELSFVEADCVCSFLYKNMSSCPLYLFFTFFDMVLSTFSNGKVLFPMPKLPFSYDQNVSPVVKQFYQKLSLYFDKPLARYGLSISGLYSESELADAIKIVEATKQEIETFLALLKMNRNSQIRCYHLLSVIQSYGESKSSQDVQLNISVLSSNLDKKISGLSLLKIKNYKLEDTLVEAEFISFFPNAPKQLIQTIFHTIDHYSRSYIFGHQIATLIDISHRSNTLKEFPLSSNTQIDPKIKNILSTNSKHLDSYNKSAISYYKQNKIPIDEKVDCIRFCYYFSSELTQTEASLIFNSLDVSLEGKICVYYYISCVESFCRNTSALATQIPSSPLRSIFSLALEIPLNRQTKDFFTDCPWYSLITKDEFIKYLGTNFGINIDSLIGIYKDIDRYEKGKIFCYQFLAYVDIYRNCINDGKIEKEPTLLPYK